MSVLQLEIAHPAISSCDFGRVVELKANHSYDDEKYALLKHCFVPSSSYTFPTTVISGHHRSFQHSWLSRYNGLCYSVRENDGYCKFCVLFAKCGLHPSVHEGQILTTRLEGELSDVGSESDTNDSPTISR